MHVFMKKMVAKNRGHILNVASIAAFSPGPMQAAFHASKAFVVSISRALDYEMREVSCAALRQSVGGGGEWGGSEDVPAPASLRPTHPPPPGRQPTHQPTHPPTHPPQQTGVSVTVLCPGFSSLEFTQVAEKGLDGMFKHKTVVVGGYTPCYPFTNWVLTKAAPNMTEAHSGWLTERLCSTPVETPWRAQAADQSRGENGIGPSAQADAEKASLRPNGPLGGA